MKRFTGLLLACMLAYLTGCTTVTAEVPSGGGIEFSDALGHSVQVFGSERVVAASGSFAQVWLLAGGKLVGTTEDAFKNNLGVPEDVASVGNLHAPSLESIIALNPQLVILSADLSGHAALYGQLTAANIHTAYFSVEAFEDYLSMLKICTDITGRKDLYQQNGLNIQSQVQKVIAQNKGNPSPKVLLLRAGAGKVTARNSATMAGTMLRDMGCINIADSETSLLENLSMETIIEQDPDFIFTISMGDSQERAQKALQDTLLSNPAWSKLSAVKAGRYIALPKELFHQKPNNRWGESYEKLWEILYGEK